MHHSRGVHDMILGRGGGGGGGGEGGGACKVVTNRVCGHVNTEGVVTPTQRVWLMYVWHVNTERQYRYMQEAWHNSVNKAVCPHEMVVK